MHVLDLPSEAERRLLIVVRGSRGIEVGTDIEVVLGSEQTLRRFNFDVRQKSNRTKPLPFT
jgi:hypothetical protein